MRRLMRPGRRRPRGPAKAEKFSSCLRASKAFPSGGGKEGIHHVRVVCTQSHTQTHKRLKQPASLSLSLSLVVLVGNEDSKDANHCISHSAPCRVAHTPLKRDEPPLGCAFTNDGCRQHEMRLPDCLRACVCY